MEQATSSEASPAGPMRPHLDDAELLRQLFEQFGASEPFVDLECPEIGKSQGGHPLS